MTKPKKTVRRDANPRDAEPDVAKPLNDESRGSPESLIDDVPPRFRERFAEIVERIDEFCERHLNEEYREVGTNLAAHVCQEGSPVLTGKPAVTEAIFAKAY